MKPPHSSGLERRKWASTLLAQRGADCCCTCFVQHAAACYHLRTCAPHSESTIQLWKACCMSVWTDKQTCF